MEKTNRRSKRTRWLKLTGIMCLLLAIGTIWQHQMMLRESSMFSSPGEIFATKSFDLHAYRTGEGDTAVVFVAGSGTPSAYTDYYLLQNQLRPYARTVSYDRAGFGWSGETDRPRSVEIMVDELHDSLEQAHEAPPYLLVGHSLASLEVLHFAQKYPDEVKGIVLLDGGSPEFYAKEWETKSYIVNRLVAALRVTGIIRALGTAGILLPFAAENLRNPQLPEEVRAMDKAMYYNKAGNTSNLSFISLMNENAQIVLDHGHLKEIPLLILSSDSGAAWRNVQQELLQWSSNSMQETITNANHYIHWTNSDLVFNKLLDMLNKE
ncbi:alpha/beta fold hydrolase [Paenibacillus luteus]|uniref:alpha/beta fold hydrolase n=1 Tax=Paenibacillus luteus TaxID=2545753 RepID=UPI0011421FBB|nr:alpha/beta hydrolase [Paenibacillus luteus]